MPRTTAERVFERVCRRNRERRNAEAEVSPARSKRPAEDPPPERAGVRPRDDAHVRTSPQPHELDAPAGDAPDGVRSPENAMPTHRPEATPGFRPPSRPEATFAISPMPLDSDVSKATNPESVQVPTLTDAQLAHIERQRRAAEQRRRTHLVMQPAEGLTRRGTGTTTYPYQAVNLVLLRLVETFGVGGFTIEPYSPVHYECREVSAPGSSHREPMIEHLAIQEMKLTIFIDGTERVYRATGSSVQTRTVENALRAKADAIKAAESDGLKRCARYLGPVFANIPDASPGPPQ